MFNITWKHTCFECRCPLNVKLTFLKTDVDLFIRDVTSWAYLRPFCLFRNNFRYKFYGLVVRRVCISCYFYPKRINLLNREIGKKVTMNKIIKSKTSQEIYDYFNSFVEFRKRKDLEMCIVEEYKRKFIHSLLYYWKVEDTEYQILF
jgi:hypothetical protein